MRIHPDGVRDTEAIGKTARKDDPLAHLLAEPPLLLIQVLAKIAVSLDLFVEDILVHPLRREKTCPASKSLHLSEEE